MRNWSDSGRNRYYGVVGEKIFGAIGNCYKSSEMISTDCTKEINQK